MVLHLVWVSQLLSLDRWFQEYWNKGNMRAYPMVMPVRRLRFWYRTNGGIYALE
jgi:hypothetical protein